MNTLAVCTFDDVLEIAVGTGGSYTSRVSKLGMTHSESLLPGILELLSEAGLDKSRLDLLCCARGPGSFTGLRIGMSALKGLAMALDRPLVSVPTMELLAHGRESFDGAVVPLLDARKKRYYAAVFSGGVRVCPDLDCTPGDLAQHLEGFARILFTGHTDVSAFAEQVAKAMPGERFIITEKGLGPAFPALLELGEKYLAVHGPDDIGQGPSYIRKSEAEEALEERLRREKDE